MKLRHLILRQRFGREEVERAARRIAQDRIEHGQVVAKRLARRRRRRDDDVAARRDVGEGFGLMDVELRDAAAFECGLKSRIDRIGKGREPRLHGWKPPDGGDDAVRRVLARDPRAWRELFERSLKRNLLAFEATDRGKAHGLVMLHDQEAKAKIGRNYD